MKKNSRPGRKTADRRQGVSEEPARYEAAAAAAGPLLRYAGFEITNFRCFEGFRIAPLSLVNLITGMNNVGKTALLEAFFLHIGSGNPGLALRINLWRGLGAVHEWTGMLWRTLFWQFQSDEPIRLVAQDSQGRRRSLVVIVKPTPTEVVEKAPAGMGLEFAKELSYEIVLEYQEGRGKRQRVKGIPEIVQKGDLLQFQLRTDPPVAKTQFPGVFINSWRQGVTDEEVQRFSDLRIRNEDHVVLEVLQHLEPRLERLEILSPHGASMIHGHLRGYKEPVPLSLLGDGMRRVASLLLALGSARGGVILVDEIENGVHHSVMRALWNSVGKAARMFSTQVIATTHSLECAASAHEAFKDQDAYDFALHRLDRTDGVVRAVTYDRESLEGAFSIPMEVRG
jgi:hypothetical protein